jgi:hypothetical protein
MAIITCIECKQEVSDKAKACPHCGYPISGQTAHPLPSSSSPPFSQIQVPAKAAVRLQVDSIGQLQEIAYRQKMLLYSILVNILSIAPITVLFRYPSLEFLGGGLWLSAVVLQLWCWYRLGTVFGISQSKIWLLGVCLFVPYISLFILLVVNGRATSALKKAGVRVGLLGADLRTLRS